MAVKSTRRLHAGHDAPRPDSLPFPRGPPGVTVAHKAAPPRTNVHITTQSPPPDHTKSPISLSQLSRLARLERYQTRRSRQVQQHLSDASITAARTARLAHNAQSIQRTLAECIRSEDKHGFTNLFSAFHDALADCSSPPQGRDTNGKTSHGAHIAYPPSFLYSLPSTSKARLVDLLTSVKTDASFLSTRISALSHKEKIALLPAKGLSRSDESIFASSPRAPSRTSRNLGYVVDGQTDLLSSYDLASPLEVLIHSVRDLRHLHLDQDETATRIWATVCSRLLTDLRPGSEKLVPAIIDAWASSSAWPGKERLELWLLNTLQQGSFLLEQPQKQTFKLRVQGRAELGPEEETRREQFFSDVVDSLFSLLVDPDGASVIPPGALVICRAIHAELGQGSTQQRALANFAITRWLSPYLLLDAVVLPEAHGLLTDYFISDLARQRILREVANRCSKMVFDVTYAWRHGNVPSKRASELVHALASRFETPSQDLSETRKSTRSETTDDFAFVAISASDVQTLVHALYPAPGQPSLGDRDSTHHGLRSSASSISGFSLFQTAAPSVSEEDLTAASLRQGSIDSSLEAATSENGLSTNADAEGEQLREICIALDDSLCKGRPTTTADHWAIFVRDPTDSTLCSIYDTLARVVENEAEPTDKQWLPSMNRSFRSTLEELLENSDLLDAGEPRLGSSGNADECASRISRALAEQVTVCEEAMDLVRAQGYAGKLRQFQDMISGDGGAESLIAILESVRDDRQRSLDAAGSALDLCDGLFRSSGPCLEKQSSEIQQRLGTMKRLRNKMWYAADVRTSATYDELRAVTSALKVMAEKSQAPARTRLAPSSRLLNGSRGSVANVHLKTETQVLDLLTAPVGHGGRNKLGDDQSKALAVWMARNTIENLCRGEERIHKLCMEIQRAVYLVTSETSTLLASDLLAVDRPSPPREEVKPGLASLHGNGAGLDLLSLHTNIPTSIDAMSSASSRVLSARSSRDYLDSWSPSGTNRSSVSIWSPVLTDADSPSSITSVGSIQTQSANFSPSKPALGVREACDVDFVDSLQQQTTSLLISDVTTTLFSQGSETDQAFWTGLGGELTEKHIRTLLAESSQKQFAPSSASNFDFDKAFTKLMSRFSASTNPYVKLNLLLDVDILIGRQAASSTHEASSTPTHALPKHMAREVPSTRIADVKVDGFHRLFCAKVTRPAAVFRDLQYIAALVPSQLLETSPQGKAFWNAAVAISGLRQDLCTIMVETADSIIAYHSNKRGHGRSSSSAQQQRDSAAFPVPTRSPSPEAVSGRSMADAAWLLQITAKEGDAVAQRELATLYLTHPELMQHVLAPFARPRDVFKEELESKWRKNQDPARCDPTTMCVAHHWMSLSSKGGDALATEFLRQREEMERLP